MSLDQYLFQFIHGLSGKSFVLDQVAVLVASYLPYALLVAVLIYIFKIGSVKERLETGVTLAFTVLLSRGFFVEILQYWVDRPRPFIISGFEPLVLRLASDSFPSVHASFFFALAFIMYSFNVRFAHILLALSILNGFARVYVGVHYPLDILGGIVVAAVSASLVWLLLRYHLKARAHKLGSAHLP